MLLVDGTPVTGRSLRRDVPGPDVGFGLYLGAAYRPAWPHVVLAWPDFWLPRDPGAAVRALRQAYGLARSGTVVEVATGAIASVERDEPADGEVDETPARDEAGPEDRGAITDDGPSTPGDR